MKPQMKHVMILVALLLSQWGWAQETPSNAFSLQQAIDYAMKNSPSAVNADNDIISAKYKKREIAGIGYPQINASFDVKDYFKIPVSVLANFVAPAVYQGIVVATTPSSQTPVFDADKLDPNSYAPIAAQFGTKYQVNGGVSLSQIIFNSDYIVALQAADYLEKIGTINANRTKADLIAAVTKAYYSVLVNSSRLEVMNSNLTRLSKNLNDLKAYNQQGLVELIDVERLEVTYNNLLTEKENVERLMTLSNVTLRFQMGYPGEQVLELTDKLPDTVNEEPINLSKVDPSARPEFQLLTASYELNVINLRKEKLGYLPSVVGYANAAYNSFGSQLDMFKKGANWYPTVLIGGTVSMKLFDGLQRHNRIQQVKLDINKSKQNLNMLQQSVGLETNAALIAFNNAIASVKSQSRNKELARHVQEVAQKKYQQGVGSNLEVVTAEAGLREADANYFNAVYNLLVARVDYLKATGQLVK